MIVPSVFSFVSSSSATYVFTGQIRSFSGYLRRQAAKRDCQVRAIWSLLDIRCALCTRLHGEPRQLASADRSTQPESIDYRMTQLVYTQMRVFK